MENEFDSKETYYSCHKCKDNTFYDFIICQNCSTRFCICCGLRTKNIDKIWWKCSKNRCKNCFHTCGNENLCDNCFLFSLDLFINLKIFKFRKEGLPGGAIYLKAERDFC